MLSFSPTPIFTGSWDHRPVVPSPLSSSPIRASSPLSPIDHNSHSQRQTQSSPIQPPKFKYASRPTRPNPVVRKREDMQESRRKTFLQNVRQKAEDKSWQRRDIEGQLLKSSLMAHRVRLAQGAPTLADEEIEELERMAPGPEDDEEMMLDHLREEEELEAMIASYEEDQPSSYHRPASPSWSDEDFDDISMDFMVEEQSYPSSQQNQGGTNDHQMDDFNQ